MKVRYRRNIERGWLQVLHVWGRGVLPEGKLLLAENDDDAMANRLTTAGKAVSFVETVWRIRSRELRTAFFSRRRKGRVIGGGRQANTSER